jgi:hypothetical protein
MADEQLLAEWYAARGSRVARLSSDQEAVMRRNLRARQKEIDNPKPLEYCVVCQCNARGIHRSPAQQIGLINAH